MVEDKLIDTTSIWKDVSHRLILIVYVMVSRSLFYNDLRPRLTRKIPYLIKSVSARKLLAFSVKSFESFTKLN